MVRIPLLPHSVVYLSKVVNVILIVVLVYLSVQLMSGELYEHANTGG